MLLVGMHSFHGMLDAKLNVFEYPELLRLCSSRDERAAALRCAA